MFIVHAIVCPLRGAFEVQLYYLLTYIHYTKPTTTTGVTVVGVFSLSCWSLSPLGPVPIGCGRSDACYRVPSPTSDQIPYISLVEARGANAQLLRLPAHALLYPFPQLLCHPQVNVALRD